MRSMIIKCKHLADHMWGFFNSIGDGNSEIRESYERGEIYHIIENFTIVYPNTAHELKKYHFNDTSYFVNSCVAEFRELYSERSQPLLEAEILYNKGFDRTDLLMLADEVDDQEVAFALRTAKVFRRGFWALDMLRRLSWEVELKV